MKRALSAAFLFVIAGSAFAAEQTHRYLVSMKPERGGAAREAKGIEFAGRDFQDLRYLDMFAANLTDDEAQALRKDLSVRYVESAEIRFHIADAATTSNATTEGHPINAQVTPYGIAMVHAQDVWPVERGDGINVAVVDTGVDYTHPELKNVYQGGFNAITLTSDPRDDNGHGTHCSGIIAAADNNIGVVGVAPNVKLWGVKVLQADGNGDLGVIAAGLNWVLSKKTELGGNWIVNMSLGGPKGNAALVDACNKLSNAGVLVFAAAGNKSPDSTIVGPDPVSVPASYSTVKALRSP
jgi:subtilisin family serine protease